MRHPIRFVILPVALGAVALSACGSDSTGSATDTNVAVSVATSSGFNDADVVFAQGMIPHHEQAVEMADLALRPETAASADTAALATQIKRAQDPEVVLLTSWLDVWAKAAGSDPDVLLLADQIIAAQQAEIDQMNALLAG